jgi:hypothetical protein
VLASKEFYIPVKVSKRIHYVVENLHKTFLSFSFFLKWGLAVFPRLA